VEEPSFTPFVYYLMMRGTKVSRLEVSADEMALLHDNDTVKSWLEIPVGDD